LSSAILLTRYSARPSPPGSLNAKMLFWNTFPWTMCGSGFWLRSTISYPYSWFRAQVLLYSRERIMPKVGRSSYL